MVMNLYFGGFSSISSTVDAKYIIYKKSSDLGTPGRLIFVFLDEREDAINWGNFYADMAGYSPRNPALYMLGDMPKRITPMCVVFHSPMDIQNSSAGGILARCRLSSTKD